MSDNREKNVYIENNWLSARDIYAELFKVNEFKHYLMEQRRKVERIFNRNKKKKVTLSLKLPPDYSKKIYPSPLGNKISPDKYLKAVRKFKPVNNSGFRVNVTHTLPSIKESIRMFNYVPNVPQQLEAESQNTTKQKRRYKSKTLKFNTDKKETTSNTYIDNLESNISTLSKYMNFDANTREKIMNSKFKGDHMVPFSPFFEYFCNIRSNLTVNFNDSELGSCRISTNRHSIDHKLVYFYGQSQLNDELVSMEAVEKKFPKEFREKAIPYAKTSSPFYNQKAEEKQEKVLSIFKSLKIKKPEWDSDPLKSAQNRVTRYLLYRSVGLANHGFKFSKEERKALLNESKENDQHVISKAINVANIATRKLFRRELDRKLEHEYKSTNRKNTVSSTPITGFHQIEGLDM